MLIGMIGRLVLCVNLFVLGVATRVAGQADDFHILLTNDDGVESIGLQALAEQLRAIAHVHVLAPCGERSGSSMAVALRDTLQVRAIPRPDGSTDHCVNTTPAGVVLLGLSALVPEGGFDLIVSGINRGANVGVVSLMSGTVGGAMMGAIRGVPAVAASFGARSRDFGYAARFVRAFVEEMRRHPPVPGVVFSINIPQESESATAGVRVVPMGGMYLRLGYEEVESSGDVRRFQPRIGLETVFPEGSDTAIFMQDWITITPLQFDWTDRSALAALQTWAVPYRFPRRRS